MQDRPQKYSLRVAPLPCAPSWFEWCIVLFLALVSMAASAQSQNQIPARPGRAATSARVQAPAAVGTPQGLRSPSLEAAFRRADSDSDGRLSRQETEHFPMLAERFEQIDRNRDRHLSREEFQRAAQD